MVVSFEISFDLEKDKEMLLPVYASVLSVMGALASISQSNNGLVLPNSNFELVIKLLSLIKTGGGQAAVLSFRGKCLGWDSREYTVHFYQMAMNGGDPFFERNGRKINPCDILKEIFSNQPKAVLSYCGLVST